MIIATYLRTSAQKQETAAQRHAIARWCIERGYEKEGIVEYVDESVSGATTDRSSFQRLLSDVRLGKVRRIVTFELSRLSRDFIGLLDVMRTLTDYGVIVEVPGEGPIAFGSTLQQFLVAARSLAGAVERERIRERTRAGLAAARARGKQVGAPKGHCRNRGRRKVYDPSLVEKIVLLHSEGLATRKIAAVTGVSKGTVGQILRRHGSSI